MAQIKEKSPKSDFLVVQEFCGRGYTVDEIGQQCGLSIDAIIKLKQEVEKNQRKELGVNAAMVIYMAIDSLEKAYRRQIDLQTEDKAVDVKMMQGVERCLELKMKLLGFDGKQQPVLCNEKAEGADDDIVIDIGGLSHQTVKELVEISRMKQ